MSSSPPNYVITSSGGTASRAPSPNVTTGSECIVLSPLLLAPLSLRPGPVWDCLSSQHTVAFMCLQYPSHSCESLRLSQFLGGGICSERNCEQHTKSGPPALWECTGLSSIPPPNRPRKTNRERPLWLGLPRGYSRVGLQGLSFPISTRNRHSQIEGVVTEGHSVITKRLSLRVTRSNDAKVQSALC